MFWNKCEFNSIIQNNGIYGTKICKNKSSFGGAQHVWFSHWLIDCHAWSICFVTHAIILCSFANLCFSWSNQLIIQVHSLLLLVIWLFLDWYFFGIHVWSINCHTYFSLISRDPFFRGLEWSSGLYHTFLIGNLTLRLRLDFLQTRISYKSYI